MKNNLFLDLDGVFSDWNQGYINSFGEDKTKHHIRKIWSNISRHESFWIDLPKKEHFDVLWDYVKNFNPTILTGVPNSGKDKAVLQKIEWCANNFGSHVEVITCQSKLKYTFMKNEGDVLIDDMKKNCDAWDEHGGKSILYIDNPEETISKLKEYGF